MWKKKEQHPELIEENEKLKKREAYLIDIIQKISSYVETVVIEVEKSNSEIETLGKAFRSLKEKAESIEESVRESSRNNERISEQARKFHEDAIKSSQELSNSIPHIQQSLEDIKNLSASTDSITDKLVELGRNFEKVDKISSSVKGTAKQINLVALNAQIETSRLGEMGKGFAVLSDEMSELSKSSSEEAGTIRDEVTAFKNILDVITEEGQKSSALIESSRNSAGFFQRFTNQQKASLDQLTGGTEMISESANANNALGERNSNSVREMMEDLANSTLAVKTSTEKMDYLHQISIDLIRITAIEGIESTLSKNCQRTVKIAKELTSVIEAGIERNEISEEMVFDFNYQLISGTAPKQYNTGLVRFAETHIQPILNKYSDTYKTEGIVLQDKNGFIPTHISAMSKPQIPGDKKHNYTYCWNKTKIKDKTFDRLNQPDHAISISPFTGKTAKEIKHYTINIASPIFIKDKHWGLARMAYKVN